jgi:hypothetical protein
MTSWTTAASQFGGPRADGVVPSKQIIQINF